MNNYEEKISLDELYDRQREIEINRLEIYRKILNRIHKKIKIVSRQNNETFFFYNVPEFIFGIPKYNVNTCISFLIDKLEENGFKTKYTHPNLLFISWAHYIPSYKREQIKKQTGVSIDGFGNIIKKKNTSLESIKLPTDNPIMKMSNKNSNNDTKKINTSEFKDVNNYKPTGIYNMDLLQKIKDKV